MKKQGPKTLLLFIKLEFDDYLAFTILLFHCTLQHFGLIRGKHFY